METQAAQLVLARDVCLRAPGFYTHIFKGKQYNALQKRWSLEEGNFFWKALKKIFFFSTSADSGVLRFQQGAFRCVGRPGASFKVREMHPAAQDADTQMRCSWRRWINMRARVIK